MADKFAFRVGAKVLTPCGQRRRKIVARQTYNGRNLYAFDLLSGGRARKWYSESELVRFLIGEQASIRNRFGELQFGTLVAYRDGLMIFRYKVLVDVGSADAFVTVIGACTVEWWGFEESEFDDVFETCFVESVGKSGISHEIGQGRVAA